MADLYWHCVTCGAHDPVEPTGGDDAYEPGDHEPCITCEEGTARVMTLKQAAALEQGIAIGLSSADALARAMEVARG